MCNYSVSAEYSVRYSAEYSVRYSAEYFGRNRFRSVSSGGSHTTVAVGGGHKNMQAGRMTPSGQMLHFADMDP